MGQESYEVGSESNGAQPNVWLPETVLPGFRDFMNSFYWECHENAKMLLRAMAIGIGLSEEDFFLKKHSGHNNQLRLLHYPQVPADDIESRPMTRMPAHCDWPTLTMVFQDDCGGLEVSYGWHLTIAQLSSSRLRTHIGKANLSPLRH